MIRKVVKQFNNTTCKNMHKIIGILQPGYLPWLGFFEQIYRSDVFVIYDDVQYDKEGWRNRNRIKTANGIQWLTVPVHVKLSQNPLIKDIKIDNKENWRRKHLNSIKMSYSKSPFLKDYLSFFEDTYNRQWNYLIDIDMYLILNLITFLGIKNKQIVLSSSLGMRTKDRIQRLIEICKIFNADIFYEGASGRNYIDEEDFIRHGIKVQFQDYKHPVYRQLYGDFVPYLSVIDLLFNHGGESLDILTHKRLLKRDEK
ncbi:MAG: WbqC family protein [Calditerrivibrio sp.]|nr:WbqC family protein [Calditerrivibrio sp.]